MDPHCPSPSKITHKRNKVRSNNQSSYNNAIVNPQPKSSASKLKTFSDSGPVKGVYTPCHAFSAAGTNSCVPHSSRAMPWDDCALLGAIRAGSDFRTLQWWAEKTPLVGRLLCKGTPVGTLLWQGKNHASFGSGICANFY